MAWYLGKTRWGLGKTISMPSSYALASASRTEKSTRLDALLPGTRPGERTPALFKVKAAQLDFLQLVACTICSTASEIRFYYRRVGSATSPKPGIHKNRELQDSFAVNSAVG